MKLTRAQEVALIEIGLTSLIRGAEATHNALRTLKKVSPSKPSPPTKKPLHKKRTMSLARRKAISRQMKARWAAARKAERE